MTICTCGGCLLDAFYGCSHVYCNKNGPIALSFLTMYQDNQEDFCDRLITHNETWVHHYDPETKAQSKQ